jgi:phospholipid/cholesterol/gamma-HCH transport system substrate-binding protein
VSRFPSSALKVAVFALVTAVVTAGLVALVGGFSTRAAHGYAALFTDATLVEGGETVRLAGVPVGRVTGVQIVETGGSGERLARLEFEIDPDVPLYRDAQLQLRYENLVGRRYLAVTERPGGDPLPPGATLPVSQTRPALDLTALFDGFQPLFRALDPEQVNQLSFEIIRTLQGESGVLAELLDHTARLTRTLGDRDAVIGRVVTNLDAVLATVDDQDTDLIMLIDRFRDLMRGLAEQRDTLDGGLPAVASLLGAADGLLDRAREPLRVDVRGLGDLAGQLRDTREQLDARLRGLPDNLRTATGLVSRGAWFSFAACGAHVRATLFGGAVELRTPEDFATNDRDTVCGQSVGGPR